MSTIFDDIHLVGSVNSYHTIIPFIEDKNVARLAVLHGLRRLVLAFMIVDRKEIFLNLKRIATSYSNGYDVHAELLTSVEASVARCISHECLHIVIEETEGGDASTDLDNIAQRLFQHYPNAF